MARPVYPRIYKVDPSTKASILKAIRSKETPHDGLTALVDKVKLLSLPAKSKLVNMRIDFPLEAYEILKAESERTSIPMIQLLKVAAEE